MSLFGGVPKTPPGMVSFQFVEGTPAVQGNCGPVVQSGPPQMLVVQGKTEGFNQVQNGSRGGAQAGDIPRIGRYLRFDKNDLEARIDGHDHRLEKTGGVAR